MKSMLVQAIYCRTSSEANADGASESRQKRSGTADADLCNVEVISGSLPKDKREKLLHRPNISKRSSWSRVLSRVMLMLARQCIRILSKQGIEFHCADAPGVFTHNPSPVQQFLRRVVLAMIELEKNLVVTRLADGRKKAQMVARQQVKIAKRQGKLKVGMLTQKGAAKSSGPSSFLASYGEPTKLQKGKLKQAIMDRDNGIFGWRTLKDKINEIMDIYL